LRSLNKNLYIARMNSTRLYEVENPDGVTTVTNTIIYSGIDVGFRNTGVQNIPYSIYPDEIQIYARHTGTKRYEINDHLGNNRVVITDVKTKETDTSSVYLADVSSETHYYPGGMPQSGRTFNLGSYRFGMNQQESDPEITERWGSHYTAEFWMYDSRVLRRWNIDPIDKPWESSYLTFSGNPIWFIDPNGDNATIDPTGLKRDDPETYEATKSSLESEAGVKLNETPNAVSYNTNPLSGAVSFMPDESQGFHWTIDESAGITGGSEAARKVLTGAINDTKTLSLINASKERNYNAWTGGNTVQISGSETQNLMNNAKGVNPNTVGYGLNALHEILHWQNPTMTANGDHPKPFRTVHSNDIVIKTINTIRLQLGEDYGQRTAYRIETGHYKYIPFDDATRKILLKKDYNTLFQNGKYTRILK